MTVNEDDLRKLIREEIDAGFKDRFRPMLTKMDGIQSVVDTMSNNFDDDRKDQAIIKTSQATVERLSREVLDIVSNQTKRISDNVVEQAQVATENAAQAVANAVEPAIDRMVRKVKNGVPLNQKSIWDKIAFWRR